jgi:hypothetical protein
MAESADTRFVKRIAIGSLDPAQPASEAESRERIALLNRCLAETPRGRIIAIEKPTAIVGVGNQQTVAQAVVYHVGFSRRPVWLDEDSN